MTVRYDRSPSHPGNPSSEPTSRTRQGLPESRPRRLWMCVLLVLAVSGCAGTGAASTSADTTSAGATATQPPFLDWLDSGGQSRFTAVQFASGGLIGPIGPGLSFKNATLPPCTRLMSVVDDTVEWTRTHKPPDAELDRAWQSALANFGRAAASCIDMVDNRDSRTELESAKVHASSAGFLRDGSAAMLAFVERQQALGAGR